MIANVFERFCQKLREALPPGTAVVFAAASSRMNAGKTANLLMRWDQAPVTWM